MRSGLTFDPAFPGWVLALLALAGVAVSLFAYRRSGLFRENRLLAGALAALKALTVLVLVLMLAKPQWIDQHEKKEKADLLVLLDFSESMNIRDEKNGATRFECARDLAGKTLLPGLGEKYRVRIFGFSSFLRPFSQADLLSQPLADGSSTDIGGSLLQSVRGQGGNQAAAAILLSDGVHNTGRHPNEVAPQLAAQNLPVFAVGLGGDQEYLDVELNEVVLPKMVFEKETVKIGVDLTAYGFEGQMTTVRFTRIGIAGPGERLDSNQIVMEPLEVQDVKLIGKGFRQRVEFTYRPETVGEHHLRIDIGVLPNESVKVNNDSKEVLSVAKRQIRVLLVEGQPRWGSGLVFRSLRRDPRLRVDSLVAVNSDEGLVLPIGPGFKDGQVWGPSPESRIYPLDPPYESYDCLLLGDVDPKQFKEGSLEALAERVKTEGLALIFLAGENTFHQEAWGASPLQSIIPVMLAPDPVFFEADTPFRPTSTGLLHPLLNLAQNPAMAPKLWEKVPSGFGFCAALRPRAGATTLAEHPTERNRYGKYPLLVFQRYGKGRIMAMMFEQSWMWALSPDEMVRRHRVFDRFWRGAVRYLVSGRSEEDLQGIQIQLDRDQVARGEIFPIRAKAFGFTSPGEIRVVFQLTAPDGLTTSVRAVAESSSEPEAGAVFSAEIRPEQVGEYVLTAQLLERLQIVAEDRAGFKVEVTAFEHRNAGRNSELLQALANATGGEYFDSQNAEAMLDDLPESERTVTVTRKKEFWNSIPLFFLVVISMNAEWIVRRWRDLS